MEIQTITPQWNRENLDKMNENFKALSRLKVEFASQVGSQTVTGDKTCLPQSKRSGTRRVSNIGIAFRSWVDSYIIGFSTFANQAGFVEFYMTNYSGSGVAATVEYTRKRVRLKAGWNRVDFQCKINAGEDYALACLFIDSGIELGNASSTWSTDLAMQNTAFIEPISAYYPTSGATGTAYLYFFDVEVASSIAAMQILNKQSSKFFEISETEPTDDSVLWIRPKG
ncbi:hypothetical protein [Enterococcus sp.]|uniref:hypothetical protein n=1 Tax=Enterococcus sp. TaxID=35783 RepID=UPI003C724802